MDNQENKPVTENDTGTSPAGDSAPERKGGFVRFFMRGLGALLPAILTLWLLLFAFGFVRDKFGGPINALLRNALVYLHRWTNFPRLENEDESVREAVVNFWESYHGLDLIGLLIALVLFTIAGAFLSRMLGKRMRSGFERLMLRLPVIRRVYPSVKQLTEFLLPNEEERAKKIQFRKVVAVEWPRKEAYVIAFVTGSGIPTVTESTNVDMVTVFVPNSPTPFTGFTTLFPASDVIELDWTVEEAIKFVMSGGVLHPQAREH